MFFMTTVDDATKTVLRPRRKPSKTSTSAKTSWAVFEEHEAVKDLQVPVFIDNYNHYMNGVDKADQLRAFYCVQKTRLKNWMPLLYLLVDFTIVNCYLISTSSCRKSFDRPWSSGVHKQYRLELANALLGQTQPRPIRTAPSKGLSIRTTPERHQMIKLGPLRTCFVCILVNRGQRRTRRTSRKVLGERPVNITTAPPPERR